ALDGDVFHELATRLDIRQPSPVDVLLYFTKDVAEWMAVGQDDADVGHANGLPSHDMLDLEFQPRAREVGEHSFRRQQSAVRPLGLRPLPRSHRTGPPGGPRRRYWNQPLDRTVHAAAFGSAGPLPTDAEERIGRALGSAEEVNDRVEGGVIARLQRR